MRIGDSKAVVKICRRPDTSKMAEQGILAARNLFRPVLTPQLSRLLIRPSRHNSKSSDVSVRVRVVGSAHSPSGQRLRCCDRSAQIAEPVPHPGPLAFPAAAAARRRCSLPHVSTAERVSSNSWWHCNPRGPLIDSSYVGAEMKLQLQLGHS